MIPEFALDVLNLFIEMDELGFEVVYFRSVLHVLFQILFCLIFCNIHHHSTRVRHQVPDPHNSSLPHIQPSSLAPFPEPLSNLPGTVLNLVVFVDFNFFPVECLEYSLYHRESKLDSHPLLNEQFLPLHLGYEIHVLLLLLLDELPPVHQEILHLDVINLNLFLLLLSALDFLKWFPRSLPSFPHYLLPSSDLLYVLIHEVPCYTVPLILY